MKPFCLWPPVPKAGLLWGWGCGQPGLHDRVRMHFAAMALHDKPARHAAVPVLHACGRVQVRSDDRSDLDVHMYSGHMQEGHHLTVSMTHNPTRHVVAGLMTAVAGVVPPYQR